MPSPRFALSPIDKSNAYESVQRELVKIVVSGSHQVGDKLPPEKDMAKALGVSRPVVREALGSLRALGLVDSRRGQGSFIVSTTPLSLPKRFSMYDLFEARSLIEVPVARLAARRRAPEAVVAMLSAVEAMESAPDGHAWEDVDAEYHAALARASANVVLVDLSRRVHRGLLKEMGIALRYDTHQRDRNAEHREIWNAVVAGDEEGAATAMTTHLESVLEDAINKYGDEPLLLSGDILLSGAKSPD